MIKILSCLIPIKSLRGKFRLFCYSLQIRFTAKAIGKNLYCGKFSTVNKNTIIKDNVKLNGMKISGKGSVFIGNYFVAGYDSLIISDTHNYKGNRLPYDYTFIDKSTIIEDFVWLGARAIILPGSYIGEGSIIQAGAVVHGKIPPLSIAGGNPAVVFAKRDKMHYESTKQKMLENQRSHSKPDSKSL